MTSRDERASYYDLELPDGTRTEVWAVLRAVLSPEEALGYVKACILTRIMRDGRKDVDRMREAEKVGIEAGMLREAMAAHLATPDPVTTALDAVDSHDPRECEDRASTLAMERDDLWEEMEKGKARIAELEREQDEAKEREDMLMAEVQGACERVAELERERDEARSVAQETLMQSQSWQLKHREVEAERDRWRASFDRVEADLMALRQTLDTERQAAVATAEELENRRAAMEATVMELPSDVLQDDERTLAERVRGLRRLRNQALNDLDRARKKSAELRKAYNEAFDFRDEMRRELGANDDERFPDFLRRICRELAALRDRYRERKQVEEKAPRAPVLAWNPVAEEWFPAHGSTLQGHVTWTYQPPAPGEGE